MADKGTGIAHTPTADELLPEQLRIVVVSDAEAERNGVGAYYHDLAEHLRKHVAVVETFSPTFCNKYRQLTLPLPGDKTQRIWFPPYLKIKRQVQALQPNVIIVPTPGPYGFLGWYLARRCGVRLIVGYHTHYERLMELYWNRILGRITQGYFEVLNKILFRDSNAVLANSQSMLQAARASGARNTMLIGTPLPYRFIADPTTSLSPEVRRIFFAGRLAAEKNVLNESLIGPQRPLRIAIHPHDMSYRLAKDLSDCLDRFSNK